MKHTLKFLMIIFIYSCSANIQKEYLVDKRDNEKYQIVKIGNQIWMAENLKFEADSGSWIYDNNLENLTLYGRLYNWKTACQVCPEGWHLPSDSEWMQLETTLGIKSDLKGKNYRGLDEGLKIKSTEYWTDGGNGNNSSGFSAKPAGRFLKKEFAPNDWIYTNGFYDLGKLAIFWTSSDSSIGYPGHAWFRWVSEDKEQIFRGFSNKPNGFSVRCIKNTLANTRYSQ